MEPGWRRGERPASEPQRRGKRAGGQATNPLHPESLERRREEDRAEKTERKWTDDKDSKWRENNAM